MVQAWYIDDDLGENNKRLEMHRNPPQYVDLEQLRQKTGVLYWKIDVDNLVEEGLFTKIRRERGYNYEDTIEISKETLPDFDKKIEMFYREHFHADEEIRFVLSGSGYFDVRDNDDNWIRIEVVKGDLIILPTGIHHRFTLDKENYIKVIRLFIGEPVWTAYNRPNEEHEARKLYMKQLAAGFA